MSLQKAQRAVRNLGGFTGGTSRLARPPAVLEEPDVRPGSGCPRFVAQYRDYSDGAVTFGPNEDLTQLLVLHDGTELTVVDFPSFTEQSTDSPLFSDATGLIDVNPLGVGPDGRIWWAERDEQPTSVDFTVWYMDPGNIGSRSSPYSVGSGTASSIPSWTAVLDLANNNLIVLFARTFTMTLLVQVVDMDTEVQTDFGPYDITGLFLSMTGTRATLTPDGAVWFIHDAFPHGVGRWHPDDGVQVVSGLTDGVRGTSQGLLARPDSSVWAVMTSGGSDSNGIALGPDLSITTEPCMDFPFTGVLSSVTDATAEAAVVNPFYIQWGEFWAYE